jgi:hypothetical protein
MGTSYLYILTWFVKHISYAVSMTEFLYGKNIYLWKDRLQQQKEFPSNILSLSESTDIWIFLTLIGNCYVNTCNKCIYHNTHITVAHTMGADRYQ